MIEFSCIRPTNILIIGWKPQRQKDQTENHENHQNCSVHFVAKLLRKTKCVPHFYIQCLQSHGLNACNCSNIGGLNCPSYDMHVFILFICFYLCCFCLLRSQQLNTFAGSPHPPKCPCMSFVPIKTTIILFTAALNELSPFNNLTWWKAPCLFNNTCHVLLSIGVTN